MAKVAVTGIGIISSVGKTIEETFHSLVTGAHGISKTDFVETKLKDSHLFGEIKLSNDQLAEVLGLPADHPYPRTALLGCYALREAVKHAGIDDLNSCREGFINATSVGGMDTTERYWTSYKESTEHLRFVMNHESGNITNIIADFVGLKGFTTTISTACSSAANAIMLGARMIEAGQLDRVFVGGTDALSKFTINGFNTLMILTDGYNQPFDQNRKGLNLGEAAAYLVLESDNLVKKHHRKVLAYITGFGNANDAYHQTASSETGEGNFLAMTKALEEAQLSPEAIDYINAHGTATPNNDLSEGRSVLRVFNNEPPEISSTKPFTGHTLAAAGGIEAVFSILALQNQVIFPNLNFVTPMEDVAVRPETTLKKKNLKHVLSNSFGFGGNCSSLIISKAE